MAPSTSAPQSASTLPSGAYLLTVSMSSSGNSGFSFCVSGHGEPPSFAALSVPAPVQVNHGGNTLEIIPDDPAATFRMQLQMSGANLSGTASGQFQSSATTVTVLGHAPPPRRRPPLASSDRYSPAARSMEPSAWEPGQAGHCSQTSSARTTAIPGCSRRADCCQPDGFSFTRFDGTQITI